MRTLKYAILGMLSRRELTGYDMMKEFDRGLANFWYASHSQLYPELNRLAGEGLIQYETSIKGESLERKVYRITPEGMADLRQWLEQDEPLSPTPKDVFRLRMYFGDNISRSRLLELTRAQLERRQQKLAFLQTSLEHAAPPSSRFDAAMADRLVLEGAVMRENTMVQWLEHCIETLEHCESEERTPSMEAYYYNQLDKSSQAAYHAMLTGLRAIAPSFPVPRLEPGLLSEIFLKLRLDHPEIFYAVRFTYRYYPQASSVEMVPEYLFEKSKIQEHQKAMTARIQKLTRPAMSLSDREKEQFVHDFICRNVRYDKLKKPYSHEIIGPLGQGVGVCEGIAKTVKVLCDALGVWCMVALSEANPEQGVKYRHAWNIVKLDGAYYHLDATFDNTLGKARPIRYDYFNLNDEKLLRDHEPLLYPAPACTTGDRFYYRKKKLSFTKLEDVEKRAAQAIRKNQPLIFHWRGGPLTRNAIAELTAALETAARRKELHPRIGLNWPQAVFQVSFVSQTPDQEITEEQANEGETL